MITLKDISVAFGSKVLLDRVSCSLPDGELIALVGRNGSGKSTLLRTIAGLNPHYSGEVLVNGHEIKDLSASKRAMELAFVATRRERVGQLTCRSVVAMGRAPYTNWIGVMTARDKDAIESALEAVGMIGYAERMIDTLSDGEYQRVMIARALAQDTSVILLDEPTSFLDVPGRRNICDLLAEIALERKKTVVYSTHELELACEKANSILLLTPPEIELLAADSAATAQRLEEVFS